MKTRRSTLTTSRRRLIRALGLLACAGTVTAATIGDAGAAPATNPPPPPLLGIPRPHAAGIAAAATTLVSLGGPYTTWDWPSAGTYKSFTVPVTIEPTTTPGAPFFWSYQFTTPREQGYVGLQSGSSPNGTKIALFSLWAGDAAKGRNCGPFEEFGTGYSCRLDRYEWVPGHEYRVRISLASRDATGQWYRGSITDATTRSTRTIGGVHVPAGGTSSFRGWVTWTEFFGTPTSTCAAMPKARAVFRHPYANGGAIRITGHAEEIAPGDCRAAIDELPGAVRHRYPA